MDKNKLLRRFDLFGRIFTGVAVLNYIGGCIGEYYKIDESLNGFHLYGITPILLGAVIMFANNKPKNLESHLK